MDTLVLAYTYEPIGCITWQRAVTLWYENKVEILCSDAEKPLRSPRLTMSTPSVVRFTYKTPFRRRGTRFTRDAIYLRDGGLCGYCRQHVPRLNLTFDHVVPKHRGGLTTWDNIVLACAPCNTRKGGRTPGEAGMALIAPPARPHVALTWLKQVPAAWVVYLEPWLNRG